MSLKFVLNIMKNIFYEIISVLDKVIEKYTGVHRRSIVEYGAQEIYRMSMNMFVYNETEFEEIESVSNVYFCECLQKEIIIDVEQDDIEFAQCYGDINKITVVYPKEYDMLIDISYGFQASLYYLLWDLVNDKSYKLKKHTYKSFNDIFDENSVEDLHDLATILLNTKGTFNLIYIDFPIHLEENKLKRIANNFYSDF